MSFSRTCFLVLGAHRSGTSAISGALSEMDIYFGEKLLKPSFDNPKGFFENKDIVEINDQILNEFGLKWHSQKPLPLNWLNSDKIISHKKRAIKTLNEEFGDKSLFALKDPRVCLTFPFWKIILDELSINILPVLVLRDPQSVIASLVNRNNFNQEQSIYLTKSHILSAEYFTRELNRVLVSYDEVIHSPKESISILMDELNLDQSKIAEAVNFIDRNLSFQGDLKNANSDKEDLDQIMDAIKSGNTESATLLDEKRQYLLQNNGNRNWQSQNSLLNLLKVMKASVGIIIERPSSFIRKLNFQNLKVLLSAVKEEKPSTIISNLKKLVEKK